VEFDTECIPAETVTLSDKGKQSLKEYCELRNDVELTKYLSSEPSIVIAHVHCRKAYANKKSCEKITRRSEKSPHEITVLLEVRVRSDKDRTGTIVIVPVRYNNN